jgi:hypothetical protein
MDKEDTLLAFALVSTMGLIARGATPSEVRDMAWVYAQFAMNGKPNESDSNSD